MIEILHIAEEQPADRVWIEQFYQELRKLGQLTVIEDGQAISEEDHATRIRRCNILITCWGSVPVPPSIAEDRGSLEYICHVTGTVRQWIPLEILEAGIPVTNWGDAPAGRLAEGAFTLLLACLKDLPGRTRIIRSGGWHVPEDFCSGILEGLNVGIYGCGMIGRRFVEMLRPFRPVIRIFDPYTDELPKGCIAAESLHELFSLSEAIVIHAGLSEETRGSVTAKLLARLPRNGIVINTARGAIIDQDALFAELETGRLRAGLDVLEPDRPPADHPARHWDNLILTAHDIGKNRPMEGFPPKKLDPMHHICLDNIRRHVSGRPLRFVMDRTRYERST